MPLKKLKPDENIFLAEIYSRLPTCSIESQKKLIVLLVRALVETFEKVMFDIGIVVRPIRRYHDIITRFHAPYNPKLKRLGEEKNLPRMEIS